MKIILRLEYLAMFLVSAYAFSTLPFAWWWFFVLLLVPDIGMIGYVINNKVGAFTYNIFHNIVLAVLLFFAGLFTDSIVLIAVGIILFAHVSMDRFLGYGLKYADSFWHTHLNDA